MDSSRDRVKLEYKIGICFFSTKHIVLKRKSKKTGWLIIKYDFQN